MVREMESDGNWFSRPEGFYYKSHEKYINISLRCDGGKFQAFTLTGGYFVLFGISGILDTDDVVIGMKMNSENLKKLIRKRGAVGIAPSIIYESS